MREIKGAVILAAGLAVGFLAGIVHGAAIQKAAEKPEKLSVVR
jgi:F0F1-type ATP synthase membrane subunit c/vacuolar-type H+-ATPase subunit K